MTDTSAFSSCMDQGAALHAAGQPEQALVAFEQAMALAPDSADAASACATMLGVLGQAQAAYRVLQSVRGQLWADADGAANLAIAAENCGEADDARAVYARALELDPDHLRALNNTALACARAGDWPGAIEKLERCRMRAPQDLGTWLNLSDILVAARRFGQALALLNDALRQFAQQPALVIRRAVALAFDGHIAQAQQALDGMDARTRDALRTLMEEAGGQAARTVRKTPKTVPDAYDMFCQQAFDALQLCDWRHHDLLTSAIRDALADMQRTGAPRDGRDTQFYGLMLPLHEDELAQIRRFSTEAIGRQLDTPMAPFVATRSCSRDSRIHVGLAPQTLRDPRHADALVSLLRLHDTQRFALHVYSSTPQPDLAFTRQLGTLCASAVEIAHMSDDEAVSRIRLDELDIFVDMAFDSPWCRPEIPERRVAPIQIRQTTWHRHHPPRPCEYNMSDTFVHPLALDMAPYGAVVRLPHSCWLAANTDAPDTQPVSREALGLPQDALVLCTLIAPLMVDPQTFRIWMALLQELPQAVWWLPSYGQAARANLACAARAAGIDPSRLVFMQPATRAQLLARVRLADLFVDTLRFNANHGLADALRMGVPAVSCAGDSMASRLGGSILWSAGLADCVATDTQAYVDMVLRLAGDPLALSALRQRLADAAAAAAAPFFNLPARVREWEWAWAAMVQRQQTGLAPAAFDVPDQTAAALAGAAGAQFSP